jgi:hypothetical protein
MSYPSPLTREQRDLIRAAVDAKRREVLRQHQARLERGKTTARRRTTWQSYYWRNRDKILARRAERKQAA